MLRLIGSVIGLAFLMVACGGGGGGSASGPPPPPATYTVGGTVTGLAGSGLVLHSDFGGDLPISASGSFTFSTRLVNGSAFNVGVKTNPASPLQYCGIANGAGAVAAANVTNVTVTCENGYTVGGTVSGLVGSGLALRICIPNGSFLGFFCVGHTQVSANGAFTLDGVFPSKITGPGKISGAYVDIAQDPSSPTQPCVVGNARIGILAANDTSVTVACSEFAYVTNGADNTLSAYGVDATTGALAAVGTPTATGTSPYAIVGTQDKRYVFVGNEGSNDVSVFAVNTATGALTAVSGSPFAAGTDPQAMALYGSSSLYVANAGSDTVSAYTIDANTGALTPLSPATYATGKGPASIAVDFRGRFIFVANNGGSNDISVFSIDLFSGGALGPVAGSPFPAGGNPLSLALGAGGKFLYSANSGGTHSSISGFSVDPASGALSPLSGSPFPVAVSNYIATDQTGAFLYVTSGANVVGYGIDATTGALTALPGFPVGAGANAHSVTIDPTNQFLYVANDGAASITGFRLDASTGALTLMPDSPFPAGNRPDFLATF